MRNLNFLNCFLQQIGHEEYKISPKITPSISGCIVLYYPNSIVICILAITITRYQIYQSFTSYALFANSAEAHDGGPRLYACLCLFIYHLRNSGSSEMETLRFCTRLNSKLSTSSEFRAMTLDGC